MKHNIQLKHSDIKQQSQKFPLCVVANNIEIAGNVGSLFRVADAFGIEKLFLTGSTAVPPKYKIRKAARSADERIPYEVASSALEVVTRLKSQGYKIISLEITSNSQDIRQLNLTKAESICLIIGAENAGIDQALLDLSDLTVHIPMYGKNSSMNVATSCAIALYELIRDF